MEIALHIAGVGSGHEVITTPLSWVATGNVILEVGARPVFVDIDPVTRNIDLERIEQAITPQRAPSSRSILLDCPSIATGCMPLRTGTNCA